MGWMGRGSRGISISMLSGDEGCICKCVRGCGVEVRGAVNGVVFPFSSFLVFFLRQKSGFLLLVVFGALDNMSGCAGEIILVQKTPP